MSDHGRFSGDDISQFAKRLKSLNDQVFSATTAGTYDSVTVDSYGKVTSGNNTPALSRVVVSASTAGELDKTTTTPTATTRLNYNGNFYATSVYGAVFNDYAEFRQSLMPIQPGRVAVDTKHGDVYISTKRMQKSPMIVSDTFGFAIGEQDAVGAFALPIAVAGRVLVYTDKDRETFSVGDVVCSGKNGTVSKMKWYEKVLFPECIAGVVSEIPDYEKWGTGQVEVNNRIWIRVK